MMTTEAASVLTTPDPAQGLDSRFCGAKKRQGEGDCHRPAGWGTSHPGSGRCKLHGGSTRDQTVHVSRERARAAVEKLGDLRDVDPHTALLEEVQRSAGAVAVLELQLESVTDSDMRAGVSAEWRSERRAVVYASKVAIDCGVEVRRVELEKARVAMQAQSIRAGMDAVSMSDEDRSVFLSAMLAQLRVEGDVAS